VLLQVAALRRAREEVGEEGGPLEISDGVAPVDNH
jgi:hypothetical protein